MIERAVIDAGPLVALSLLGQLDFLPALFSEVWVTQRVFNEVAGGGIGKPGAQSLQSEKWQKRVRTSPLPDPLLVMELDAGEADVISLARHLSPCVAVIDERRGSRVASFMQVWRYGRHQLKYHRSQVERLKFHHDYQTTAKPTCSDRQSKLGWSEARVSSCFLK